MMRNGVERTVEVKESGSFRLVGDEADVRSYQFLTENKQYGAHHVPWNRFEVNTVNCVARNYCLKWNRLKSSQMELVRLEKEEG